MKARLVTVILGLAFIALSADAVCAQAVAQANANKPARPARKAKANSNAGAAAPAAQAAPAAPAAKAAPAKPAKKKKKAAAMSGVPNGVANCIKHLQQMAEKDPLPEYDGHPSEIINGGLLWNDPKSKCSVAADDAKRKKVIEIASAWRMKDAAKVRSLLSELAAM